MQAILELIRIDLAGEQAAKMSFFGRMLQVWPQTPSPVHNQCVGHNHELFWPHAADLVSNAAARAQQGSGAHLRMSV